MSQVPGPERRDDGASTRASGEWRQRPWLSRALRLLIVVVPVGVSFGIALLLSRTLPRANGPWTAALWIGVVAVASLLTLVVFEKGARRLLPLAALLNMSLLFPDQAPKRFAVARRSGSPRELLRKAQAAQASGHDDDAQHLGTVIQLVLALSVHDRASRGHSERVRVFTDLLADELKIPEEGRARLRWAALLHDIGKLEVPASVLNKPARPTEEEWVILRRHPEDGARIVAPLLPWLGEWGAAVAQHHERIDGTGYPNHLKGHEISLAARIVSVADVWEVMTSPRPYQRQMSIAAARRELIRVAGTQLDPVLVRAFLNISVGSLWKAIGIGTWIAQLPTLGRFLSEFGGWAGSAGAAVAATSLVVVGGVGGTAAPSLRGPTAQLTTPAPSDPTSLSGLSGSLPGIGGTGTSPPAPGAPSQSSGPRPTTSGGPAPSASSRPTSSASSRPTPTPTARPTPPAPSPTPYIDPWSCGNCTTTNLATCTSQCKTPKGGKLAACTSYCESNSNLVCTSHCLNNNNPVCTTYCTGNTLGNNPLCTSNCRPPALTASWTTGWWGRNDLGSALPGSTPPRLLWA